LRWVYGTKLDEGTTYEIRVFTGSISINGASRNNTRKKIAFLEGPRLIFVTRNPDAKKGGRVTRGTNPVG